MVFFNSCLFLQNLLCRHWLYFWKIARRNSPNFEKFPAQGPKKIRIYGSCWSFAFLRKILWTRETQFLKRCKSFYPGQSECKFDSPVKKTQPKDFYSSAQSNKSFRECLHSYWKLKFLRHSSVQVECSFENPAFVILLVAEIFWLKFQS